MLRTLLIAALTLVLIPALASAQTREQKVRGDKEKVEAKGYWIYNDLPRAFSGARQSGKPIVVVLRCLPCEECVKLDDDVIDADQRLQKLLDKFVRARVVCTNGLDLSLFQFDTDQSFCVFLLNADGTIYGRFGTRSHRTDWVGDVSLDGFAKALQGALDLHAAYPANKDQFAAKRGPAPEFPSPEKLPPFQGRYKEKLDYEGKVVQSCIHCHQIGDALREVVLSRHQGISDTLLFPYPHPKIVGLILDPNEKAKVQEVELCSDADKAGFLAGDEIQSLAGQPLVSMADVQWVLNAASPSGAEIAATVLRDGGPKQLTLKLPAGWRRRDNISWRVSTWGLRRFAFGGIHMVTLPEEDRQKWKLPADSLALLIDHVGLYGDHAIAHKTGVKKDDILIALDGRSDLLRETDLIAYSLTERKPGTPITLTVLRNGEKQTISVPLKD